MTSPKYVSIEASQVADIIQIYVRVQVGGITYTVIKCMSNDAIRLDGVRVIAAQFRQIAADLDAKAPPMEERERDKK
ncbi:MAG: hypothetical protein ACRESX_09005, partial [Gammaproteobacteria bacterium]